MRIHRPSESGQVIILLVVGIITLLGFSGLAIDGARLFSERRNAQGAADTAAFTAATYIGQYSQSYLDSNWATGAKVEDHAEAAALERIRSNGYTDAAYNPFTTNDKLRITINQEVVGSATVYSVQVVMISEIEPIFAQLFFSGPMLTNVESRAVLVLGNNVAFGNALYSLSDSDCKALKFSGNSEVEIIGAGIHSNSTCTPNAIDFSGTADASIEGTISTPGGIDDGGSSTYTSGGDIEGADAMPIPSIPVPNCSALPLGVYAEDKATSTTVFYPGKYNAKLGISSKKNNQVFMPGLYCLYNGLQVTNGNLSGSGVTFYVASGDVKITGGDLNFTAPTAGEADDPDNSWDGMLFYVAQGNWTVTAQSATYLEGTIYAPGSGNPTCKFTGGGFTNAHNVQFICTTIALIGGSGLRIQFDNTNAYVGPITVDLYE